MTDHRIFNAKYKNHCMIFQYMLQHTAYGALCGVFLLLFFCLHHHSNLEIDFKYRKFPIYIWYLPTYPNLACYSKKYPSDLQIAMSKSSCLAVGRRGQGEVPPPPNFGRCANPISIKGTDYTQSHHNLSTWILKPSYGPAWERLSDCIACLGSE